MNGQPTFHWPLEFPEVMLDRGGFDAFVCNPPFMGGKKITGNLGMTTEIIWSSTSPEAKRGSADLCCLLLPACRSLLREGVNLASSRRTRSPKATPERSDSTRLTANGYVIPRAVPSRPWPGTASLEVAHVWLREGTWNRPFVLDEKPVTGITAFLD